MHMTLVNMLSKDSFKLKMIFEKYIDQSDTQSTYPSNKELSCEGILCVDSVPEQKNEVVDVEMWILRYNVLTE